MEFYIQLTPLNNYSSNCVIKLPMKLLTPNLPLSNCVIKLHTKLQSQTGLYTTVSSLLGQLDRFEDGISDKVFVSRNTSLNPLANAQVCAYLTAHLPAVPCLYCTLFSPCRSKQIMTGWMDDQMNGWMK